MSGRSRRWLVTRSGLVLLAGALPSACGTRAHGSASPGLGNTLLLIELNGGNDGLNTVIPYADPLYAALRPRIAIDRGDVVALSEQLALHPGLAPLKPAWDSGDLAIVLGLGYERPNLSHFRSIEIWDTASASDELIAHGWVARALARDQPLPGRAVEGVVLGRPAVGPLLGAKARVAMMQDPGNFANQARGVATLATDDAPTAALRHVLATQADLRAAGDAVHDRLQRMRAPLPVTFPKTGIGGQLANAARLIGAGIDVPAIKLSHGSYDTHTYQRAPHDRMIGDLGAALAAFRATMIERGLWSRVTVMTYAEFGRRPAENSAQGTDHGTAAPHLVLGGAVKGGFHGRQPSLGDLDGGNLRHAVDFRSLYATVLRRWWGLDPTSVLARAWPELDLFA
jgi:uncharacterized protein (DUF1501 family)